MLRNVPVHWNESVKGWFTTSYFDIHTMIYEPCLSLQNISPFADRTAGSKQ